MMNEASERNIVVITGSGGGIGRAVACCFANAGYETVLLDRNLQPAWITITAFRQMSL